jgi:hypothetical protein
MKNRISIVSVLFCSILCLAALPLIANAQRWGTGPVIVYEERDGRGNEFSFNVGIYRNDRNEFGGLRNDRASSVTVPPGYRVRFCENEGRNGLGSGRCEEFGPGNHNLRYPNRASFIRVSGPTGRDWGGGWGIGQGSGQFGVTVYEDRDFRGRSQGFGIGRYMAQGGRMGVIGNDTASSVIVSPGYRVRICEHEGQGFGDGRCEEYTEGRYNLRYNDEASYIEVQRVGGWGGIREIISPPFGGVGVGGNTAVIVYSDRNQRGTQQAFGIGVFRNDLGQFGQLRNDEASSVYVARGFRVRLCENEGRGNGSGRCEEYGAGTHNLRYNDRASWIRVWRGR